MATSTLGSAYLFGPQTSGDVVTREDVLDLVVNIDPFDTPFITMAPKTTASSTLHEWVQDVLDATATATGSGGGGGVGGWTEGGDFNAQELTSRTRVTNITQIFRKDVNVSNTMRAINPHGVADEYTYQILKGTREIGRNMEAAAWRSTSATGSTANSARLWKSLEGFYGSGGDSSNSAYARGTLLSNSASNATTSAFPIRESDFNAMLEVIFQDGGNPDTVFVSPSVKRYISDYGVGQATATNLGGVAELRREIGMGERRLIRSINLYESDFGVINIVLDRWVPQATNAATTGTDMSGRMFFLERTRNRVAFLRPIRHVPLPPNGDATRGIVVGEATLEVLADEGGGAIIGVNNRAA